MPTKHAAALFSCSKMKQKLASWFTDLLDVTVTDFLKCVRQLGSLERAAEDLVNLHSQAVESYRALYYIKHKG